jgi:hypothetical protein
VTRRTLITTGAILCLLALIPFLGWPIYKWYTRPRPVSTALFDRTKACVDKNPQLKPDWDKAMEDDVLTFEEAKGILEKAGEKVEPEK